jgi:hypothetical protein
LVALKVEKAGKSKKVLESEYQILVKLQGIVELTREGLSNICPVYDFIRSDRPEFHNFIVMQKLGINSS